MPSSSSVNTAGAWSVHKPSPVHRSWSIHTFIAQLDQHRVAMRSNRTGAKVGYRKRARVRHNSPAPLTKYLLEDTHDGSRARAERARRATSRACGSVSVDRLRGHAAHRGDDAAVATVRSDVATHAAGPAAQR